MPTLPQPRFYVYALARPIKNDWQIFYIGKGSKRRVFSHEGEARGGHQCHKCHIIRKVWREGGEIQRYILLTTDDENEAFAYEQELIALHGRANLCNLTDGGEGVSGYIATPNVRAERSERQRIYQASPEARAKVSAFMKKRTSDPAVLADLRQRMLFRYESPEERAKTAEHSRAVWQDLEYRAWRTEMGKAQWKDPDIRAKRIAGLHAAQTPELRARLSAKAKVSRGTPEARAKMSERAKEMWKDPERLARAIAKRKATAARKRAERESGNE